MNEIKRFEFEGKPLEFRQVGGEWWATAEEAAALLGHKSAKGVLRLADRHKPTFRAGEQGVVNLTTPGGTQATRVFSPRGLARLCLLGRTAVSHRLHDWVIYDVMEKLRGGARLVTEEQMRAAILAAVEKVAEQFRGVIGEQAATIRALSGAVATQASSAGKLLSYMSRAPEIRRVIEEAEDEANGQTKFPWGGRLGDFGSSVVQSN